MTDESDRIGRKGIMYLARREGEELLKALRRMKKILDKVNIQRIVEHIRRDREAR